LLVGIAHPIFLINDEGYYMIFLKPLSSQILPILRAMKTVTLASGKSQPEALALIEAFYQLFFTDIPLDFDNVSTISPAELAEVPIEPSLRKHVLNGMAMLALVEGIPPKSQIVVLEEFAKAFGERSNLIEQIRSLSVSGVHQIIFSFARFRSTFLNSSIYVQVEQSGVYRTAKSLATTWGLVEDKALANRYAALATYPEGSLGLSLHHYYLQNKFALPGQKLSLPEGIASHDVSHLLSGYDVDYIGETLVAAFTAGYRYEESAFFSSLLIELMSLTNLMPSSRSPAACASIFSQPGMAQRFLRALERGMKCKVDLFKDFNLWMVAHESIPALCDRWGIEPE
jgi:hypothetical protein